MIENANTNPGDYAEVIAPFLAVIGADAREVRVLHKHVSSGKVDGMNYGCCYPSNLVNKKARVCGLGILMRERGLKYGDSFATSAATALSGEPYTHTNKAAAFENAFIDCEGGTVNKNLAAALHELLLSNEEVL